MNCPDCIRPKHQQEWLEGSGVDPEIVARNVRSMIQLT